MASSDHAIVRARIHCIRQKSRLNLQVNNIEGVSRFKEKLGLDDVDGALKTVKENPSQRAILEILPLAVDSRKNDLITKILQLGIPNKSDTDDVDGPRTTESIFQNAVLHCTLNDDPETLQAVLDWGTNNGQTAPKEDCGKGQNRSCPILVASLENYTQCITHLYKFGYEIALPNEDKKRIESVLKKKDALANDIHFYFALTGGEDNIDEVSGCFNKRVHKVGKSSIKMFDPVERYLRFKASSNPNYISTEFVESEEAMKDENNEKSLRTLDPIRKSFALAQYAKHLSSYFTQHSKEYSDIGKKCQEYAQDILEQCDTLAEVETLLEYSPNKDDDENNENTNWHLALWEGHKKFVGHHYFQNFLWNRITGENFNWDNYFFFWRILYVPWAVILFLMVPVIVIIDSLFRKSDILFVSPKVLRKQYLEERNRSNEMGQRNGTSMELTNVASTQDESLQNTSVTQLLESQINIQDHDNDNVGEELLENPLFSFFRERIHRPIFRMIVHHFLEVIYLIALGLSMIDPNDAVHKKEFWYYDYITIVFVISFFVEDLVGIYRRKWTLFSSFWSFYSLINHILFVAGGIMAFEGFRQLEDDNRSEISGNHIVNVGSTFVSIAASMAFFRITRWFLLQRTLGPVVVCIIKVLRDGFHILLLFMITFISFAIGTFSMFKPFITKKANNAAEAEPFQMDEAQSLAHVKTLFSSMFWRVFDPGEPDLASIMNVTNVEGKEEKFLSLEFSHFMGLALWAIYQAVIVILLINILIAMMNNTFTKVSEHADLHWKYSKSFYQVQFLAPRAVLPPPFRLFYYFAKLMRWLKQFCANSKMDVVNGEEDKDQKYLKLLLKLVRIKQHSDFEKSIQDDFSDLRQDIQNIVGDKQKSLQQEVEELKEMIKSIEKKLSGKTHH